MQSYANVQDHFLPQRPPTWAGIEGKHERPKALLRQKAAREYLNNQLALAGFPNEEKT